MIRSDVAAKIPERIISRESIMLMLVCAMDAVYTVMLVSSGRAVEANPLMRYFLRYGVSAFCLAKMLPLAVLICLAEYYRRSNPQFVKKALNMGTLAYVGLYAVSVVFVNMH